MGWGFDIAFKSDGNGSAFAFDAYLPFMEGCVCEGEKIGKGREMIP